ncbi:MAG: polysaccharide deacetylase family protein [Clostridia bacterium]|nr:polysaccharide deacetylase family protein [Clostridia bacterium]
MKRLDANLYPGWTRKAVSFTIDDGNLAMDEKFLTIVKPAGVIGTFNLCTPLKKGVSAEEYRRFYHGYEIANHCHRHPFPFAENRQPQISDVLFDETTADPTLAYRTEEDGFYRIHTRNWNYFVATDDKYMEFVDRCTAELETVFGSGAVKDFVWPFGEQKNPALMQRLINHGFRSIRATGDIRDKTGFALPADRMHWSYNAHHKNLLEVAKLYEAYPDDGNLKFFCFGVHSIDFERDGKWDELKEFCAKYGNRPEDYWYAPVGDIFDYEDAVKALIVTDTAVCNPSEVDLFVKIDSVRKCLRAHSELSLL